MSTICSYLCADVPYDDTERKFIGSKDCPKTSCEPRIDNFKQPPRTDVPLKTATPHQNKEIQNPDDQPVGKTQGSMSAQETIQQLEDSGHYIVRGPTKLLYDWANPKESEKENILLPLKSVQQNGVSEIKEQSSNTVDAKCITVISTCPAAERSLDNNYVETRHPVAPQEPANITVNIPPPSNAGTDLQTILMLLALIGIPLVIIMLYMKE